MNAGTAPTRKLRHCALLTALAALLFVALTPAAAAAAGSNDVARARAGTASFRDVDVARAAGYALFTDAAGIACIDNPGVGGMGIHYVKGSLLSGLVINAATPEALVYEPREDGGLRLVALEYIAMKAAWDGAGHISPPSLFGRQFELIQAPNRYGLPPFYELHAWVWKHNPSGMFVDWNPRVSCAGADEASPAGGEHEGQTRDW